MAENQRSVENENAQALSWLKDSGEVGRLMHSIDWKKTAVGSPDAWPQSLRTALSICLGTKFPMFVWWGRDLTVFYNDSYIPLAGQKHPTFLGKTAKEQWAEIWDALHPLTDQVLNTGTATWSENLQLFMMRKGFLEETYFTFSYSPIQDESGEVAGIINPCQETTLLVLSERRLKVLRDLGTVEAKNLKEVGDDVVEILLRDIYDIPFAMIFKTDIERNPVLVSSSRIEPTSPLLSPDSWLFAKVNESKQPLWVEGLRSRFAADLPKVPYAEMPDAAYVAPIMLVGKEEPAGYVVLGVSARLNFDDSYRDFFTLVVKQITTHFSNVHALEEEKKRTEVLAELDRAKTVFFSNISHEFRTPLTLILGPLEEAIGNPQLAKPEVDRLELIYRNALRLQRLVNSLLDFSRIEAGRAQARYKSIDLARFTTELASNFEGVIKKENLQFEVQCESLPEETFVDPDMWEKIVLNLISNAFKFTFSGKISVSLKRKDDKFELTVRDTGGGIPEEELPRIFERFHRVEGAKSRTYEGSGIGLALVSELVKLHGGTISVKSKINQGSTFTVNIPFGSKHLPQDKVIHVSEQPSPTLIHAHQLISDAEMWVSKTKEEPVVTEDGITREVLVADDNVDMLNYIQHALMDARKNWRIVTASNGQEALRLIKKHPPDLVVSDIMMPELDGFGLLRAIREDENLKTIPLIFLSARSGEEAKVEGIEKGADDYLVKPFSVKELVARASTQMELANLRKETVIHQEQAKMINALRKAKEAAEAANLMKSYFLANMSHEIRTPLGIILGFSDLLGEPDLSHSSRANFIASIQRNGELLSNVINDILDLSKVEAGRMKVDIQESALEGILSEFTQSLLLKAQDKQLALNINCIEPLPDIVLTDPLRVRQILVNIVGNAIKFTKQGSVNVEVKYMANSSTSSTLIFTVKDTGQGIAQKDLDKLFLPFSQADATSVREFGGTGLGLILSKRLAKLLGGDVQLLQTEVGKGSTFEITIEAGPPQERFSKRSHELQKSIDERFPLKGRQILLVEDSLDNQFLVSRALKVAGATVDLAGNGQQGIEAAARKSYDAILMDIQMPVMGGYEAVKILREKGFKQPIIALTAHAFVEEKQRALASGFNDHVSKPINNATLIDAIVQALKLRRSEAPRKSPDLSP